MNRCTTPKLIGDTRYVWGSCTWHGPISLAGHIAHPVDISSYGEDMRIEHFQLPVCPHCQGTLMESPTEEEWWATIRNHERELPGYEAMVRWSQGKCFPDFETMQNAYWQAMEGQD
jgi:hypothetical protein